MLTMLAALVAATTLQASEPRLIAQNATCTVTTDTTSTAKCNVAMAQNGELTGIGFIFGPSQVVVFAGEVVSDTKIDVVAVSITGTSAPTERGHCLVSESSLVCTATVGGETLTIRATQ